MTQSLAGISRFVNVRFLTLSPGAGERFEVARQAGNQGSMYDEQAISSEFEQRAAQADAEYRDFVRSESDDRDGDEILARSCVYGYLYARYFLESRELLLNELRWLRTTSRPHAPRHATSPERFGQVRNALLDELIQRFRDVTGKQPALS